MERRKRSRASRRLRSTKDDNKRDKQEIDHFLQAEQIRYCSEADSIVEFWLRSPWSRTAYRRLAKAEIRSCRPAVRIPLTPRHKNLRKRCCRDQSRRLEEWSIVMWSDESMFTFDFHDGRIHVHRLRGERLAPCCLQEHDRYGGGSVLVWAAIWHSGRSPLCIVDGMLTAQKYRDEFCCLTLFRSFRLKT